MSDNFNKARQTAQIIHLEGMKKGLEQLQHVIEKQVAQIDERLADVREQSADE